LIFYSSIIADQIALKCVGPDGYVVTEAGFGADIGMEKFYNIKCRASGLVPHCAVIVATVRALKMHGGGPPVVAGKPLAAEYTQSNAPLVAAGVCNLTRHVENALKFGVPVVVAINKFSTDTDEEIAMVQQAALAAGAADAVLTDHWAQGGAGAVDLAVAVERACAAAANTNPPTFKLLYESSLSIMEKIECICREIYRADGVEYSELAKQQIAQYEASGFAHLPICMAKTQYSFSCDPEAKGAPTGFVVPVREIRSCVGGTFAHIRERRLEKWGELIDLHECVMVQVTLRTHTRWFHRIPTFLQPDFCTHCVVRS
jgi:formyltetrahydrofolate synthetase